ncbi:hypothetical protein DUI87_18259 [Hirundo rustica rustica]|uniref:eIF5-mimic protein 1 n=1 Tax=Hirundo rustica rustica TaxID=333673 RepID=A0A3M0KD31_HIRRU|nr:hypothetical protein DUI87_18259 [Hirundo rustica rustica]
MFSVDEENLPDYSHWRQGSGELQSIVDADPLVPNVVQMEKNSTCSASNEKPQYAPLLAVFSTQGQSELILLQKVQEYCYDNIHFMKAFQKIVVLFYKADVLSEEAILKWYKEAHVAKGKSVFLDQMKKFVEWLQNAEEGYEVQDSKYKTAGMTISIVSRHAQA